MKLASNLITKCVVLFLVLFFFSNVSNAGFFYGKQKYYTVKTEHFYIHFPEGLGPVAEEMKTITEEEYTRLTQRITWTPWGRAHLVLSDKLEQANGLSTVIPYDYILMYVAKPEADSTLDHYKEYLRLLFTHEYTHILTIDMHYRWATPARYLFGKIVAPNGATPGWVREGFTVYEESELAEGFGRNNFDYTDMYVRTAVYENKFPRIDQIQGVQQHFPGSDGAYLFGGRFMDWIAQKYGEERVYKFQKEYASGLWVFSLNNKARRVFGKSFYKLWSEFKSEMFQKYGAQQESVSRQGLTTFEDVVKNKDTQSGYIPRPGTDGYAYFQKSFDDGNKIIIKPDAQTETQHLARTLYGQMSFSHNGSSLAFASLSELQPKRSYSDVYTYSIDEKKLKRVADAAHAKTSMRTRDPDFSSEDGGDRWLVMVRNFDGTEQLEVFDLKESKGYVITNEPKNAQLSNPRFSPDGQKIVVSEKDPQTGFRDIIIYSKTGALLTRVTQDIAPDNHPVFSRDGGTVYFDSYRSGIANIHAYHLKNRTISQITNVLDGVFEPAPASDGGIFVQHYTSEQSTIQKFTPNHSYQQTKVSEKSGNDFSGLVSSRHYSIEEAADGRQLIVENRQNQANLPEQATLEWDTEEDVQSTRPVAGLNGQQGLSENSFYVHQRALGQFAQNPDAPEYLSGMIGESLGAPKDKYEDVKVKDEDKTVTTAQGEEETYPSAYKDQLDQFPSDVITDTSNPADAKKYEAFPQVLVPRYIMPSLMFYENAVIGGVMIGRSDPLFRHSWAAYANYRSDAAFLGAGATYIYSRYDPMFYIGGVRYAVDWGDVNGTRFFEERDQAYGGVSYAHGHQSFNLGYFYEYRLAITDLAVNLTNMEPYAGLRFQYGLSNFKRYSDSISQESGYSFKLGGEWTDVALGASDVNEELALRADLRGYIEMPWADHHVLALRVAGGYAWGDQQQFGTYRLGGPFGEGTGAASSSRLFPLRGLPGITFGGDEAAIFSTEYRIPLATNANFGIGTWPIFVDKIHMALFLDGGDIRYRTDVEELFDRFMLATGAEVSGDFVVGYGLPITMRVGYGIVLTNRERLAGLTDAVTMSSLDYGSVYFQFGTMF